MIYKILTGDEHGGAANSSKEIIDGFLDSYINFNIVFLCNSRFSKLFTSEKITNLDSFSPPILEAANLFKKIINILKFLCWIINTTSLLLRFIKKKSIKHVHTTNNHALLICLVAKLIYPKLYIITHWRCVGLASSKKYSFLLNKIDKIIAISHAVKKSLPENLQSRCVIVYDGVDVQKVHDTNVVNAGKLRSIAGISKDKFAIGTIGSFTTIKCHDLIIDAVINSSNKDLYAVLIGSCPNVESEKYLDYLKKKVIKNNIQNNVVFLDERKIQSPKNYISDLDLFIGATWNKGLGEGFGLIYVEAMAANVPVIAINVGAASEIIENNKTGFLMDSNEPEELANVIQKAYDDRCIMPKYGEMGFNRALNNFDISLTLKKIDSLYLELIKC